jgi:hypothetical protein
LPFKNKESSSILTLKEIKDSALIVNILENNIVSYLTFKVTGIVIVKLQ